MNNVGLLFVFITGLLTSEAVSTGSMKLQQVYCESLNTDLNRFYKCSVDKGSNNRTLLNISVKIVQKVTSITFHASVFRKVNKNYEPFIHDVMVDFCGFYKKIRQRFVVWHKINQLLAKYSNMNHSCPYDHDIIVENFSFDDTIFTMIPLPRGQYKVQLKYAMNKIQASKITLDTIKS